ncbi:MAG: glycosyltransferase [Alphaproteobacteria bacterium]|nr:glycosyltransferase [Alphaproteobacteria bacterium]
MPDPRITIIIPAYNRSAALAQALDCALRQTCGDFELFVVGDDCTDESEAVATGFNDPRIHWHNLPKNSGGPSAPRNAALALARGAYIAYLDQHDLWRADHLETCLRTAESSGADITVSRAISFGPPGSGVMYASGILPHSRYSPDLLFPACSLFHKKDLVEKISLWAEARVCRLPCEGDFIHRAHLAKCNFTATDALTAFNFPAAWRRNIYLKPGAEEQSAFAEKMQRGDAAWSIQLEEDFGALRSQPAGMLAMPDGWALLPGQTAKTERQGKGLGTMPASEPLTAPRSFTMEEQVCVLEWGQIEPHPLYGTYRWSGPSRTPSIVLPVTVTNGANIRIFVTGTLHEDDMSSIRLSCNGKPVTHRIEPGGPGTAWLVADCGVETRGDNLTITIHTPCTRRPCDIGLNADTRQLGVAVNRIELQPSS